MDQTQNLNLNKPDYPHNADVQDLNENFDKIDEAVTKRLSLPEGVTVGDMLSVASVDPPVLEPFDKSAFLASDDPRFVAANDLSRVLAADVPSRADGSSLGSTDYGEFAWDEVIGSWEIGSGRIRATSLDDDRAVAVFDVESTTNRVDVTCRDARSGIGIVLAYVDTDNYLYATFNDIATLEVREVVDGTDSLLDSATFGVRSRGWSRFVGAYYRRHALSRAAAYLEREPDTVAGPGVSTDTKFQSATKVGLITFSSASDTGFRDIVAREGDHS